MHPKGLLTYLALGAALVSGSAPARAVDLYVSECQAQVQLHDVTIRATVCDNDLAASSAIVKLFWSRDTPPAAGDAPDAQASASLAGADRCGTAVYPSGLLEHLYLGRETGDAHRSLHTAL